MYTKWIKNYRIDYFWLFQHLYLFNNNFIKNIIFPPFTKMYFWKINLPLSKKKRCLIFKFSSLRKVGKSPLLAFKTKIFFNKKYKNKNKKQTKVGKNVKFFKLVVINYFFSSPNQVSLPLLVFSSVYRKLNIYFILFSSYIDYSLYLNPWMQ